MATKKKKKKATRRRRRVGAMALSANSPIVLYGSIAAGYLMGDKINEKIDEVAGGKLDAKMLGAAEGGLGAALVFMKIGKKKTMVEKVAGGVLIGAGAKRLLKEFGIINGIGGYQRVPVVGRKMNGYAAVPVVGGYQTARVPVSLNGAFNGYTVPKPAVMGSVFAGPASGTGSGLSNGGSELMG